MELLLKKGAAIDALNNGECSTLHVAVNKQHLDCVRVLLQHKANVNIQVCIQLVYEGFVIKEIGSTSDSRARGPGFDIRSRYILLFLLQLIQEGQLSVTGESMCI